MSVVASQPDPVEAEGARRGAPSTERIAALYREMVRIRVVSARLVALQREGTVAFHASSIGEEAAVAASGLALEPGDALFASVRDWGAALARGLSLEAYVRQVVGSRGDAAKGHASPDHPTARALGIHPPSGIAGAHLPQAVGWAWAARMRGDAKVSLAVFGEEVSSTGDFHNALNFAGVFKVPAVLVARVSEDGTTHERAVAYGLAAARVSGADPRATLEVVEEAVGRARAGRGPSLVCITTKRAIDLGSDPLAIAELGAADPLAAVATVPGMAVDEVVADVTRAFDAALEAALRDGPPERSTIFEDVYATLPPHLAAQAKGAVRS